MCFLLFYQNLLRFVRITVILLWSGPNYWSESLTRGGLVPFPSLTKCSSIAARTNSNIIKGSEQKCRHYGLPAFALLEIDNGKRQVKVSERGLTYNSAEDQLIAGQKRTHRICYSSYVHKNSDV